MPAAATYSHGDVCTGASMSTATTPKNVLRAVVMAPTPAMVSSGERIHLPSLAAMTSETATPPRHNEVAVAAKAATQPRVSKGEASPSTARYTSTATHVSSRK